jgi:HEAT repeats
MRFSTMARGGRGTLLPGALVCSQFTPGAAGLVRAGAIAPEGKAKPPAKADEVSLAEACQAGLIKVTLSGKDGGASVELSLERRTPVPLVVLIPKGPSTLGSGANAQEVSAPVASRIDLATHARAVVTLQQAGSRRITQGKATLEACFNPATGRLLRQLKQGRKPLLELVIAQLGDKEAILRKLAAQALGEAQDASALPGLEQVANQDADPAVRQAATAALAQTRAATGKPGG